MISKELFFVILFILFWSFHIIRRNFFWLYFWDKRGSRSIRFLNGLRENKGILFSKSTIFSLVFILLFPIVIKIDFLFESLIFALFSVFGLYSIYLVLISVYRRDFRGYFVVPRPKKKTVLLFLFILILELLFWAVLIFPKATQGTYQYSLIFLLVFEIFFPIFFYLAAIFLNFIFSILYLFFGIKAKNKIEEQKKLITIGICGSYGKTLTKEFLFQLLSKKYKVLKTEGKEAEIGDIIRTINRKLKKQHNIFISEISTYKKGEIKRICNILKPKIGILTGISEEHVSLFGNIKNIINTKFELINCLPEDGVAIFNIDNKETQKLFQRTNVKKYSYSDSEEKGDIFAKNIEFLPSKDKIKFTIVTPKGEVEVIFNSPERKNIENFLGAVTCAIEVGMTLAEIKEATSEIKMPGGFMTHRIGKNGVKIIDDTASQTPNGFLSAIDYLKRYSGKKVVIGSSLLELGRASYSIHNNIGKKMGEICDLIIITNPLFFKEMKLGVLSEGMKKNRILFLRNSRKILKKLEPYLREDNVILLEGDISDKIKKEIIE
ncbi:MAG: Mur ligase family protein [Candidatus Pacebacteria bacterium]|nr:Mur ligase family protein [Candidatus Paceibacterota bacterium]